MYYAGIFRAAVWCDSNHTQGADYLSKYESIFSHSGAIMLPYSTINLLLNITISLQRMPIYTSVSHSV